MVKTQFSIKDLENLSGVKAHTIRIWEKRYDVLKPSRTDTNIRKYGLQSLKRILNISSLYNEGYKISKIATLDNADLEQLVLENAAHMQDQIAINTFKTAMIQFDQQLFANTYNSLRLTRSFEEIFKEVFIPFLTEIGILWQTGTIDPCHERFASEMIKQKISINIEKLYANTKFIESPKIVLFLPNKEIHEIGLMYANYECIANGIATIYLGTNIPLTSLPEVTKHHDNLIFVTYLTVQPDDVSVSSYINNYQKIIGESTGFPLWLLGHKIQDLETKNFDNKALIVKSIPEFITALKSLKKT